MKTYVTLLAMVLVAASGVATQTEMATLRQSTQAEAPSDVLRLGQMHGAPEKWNVEANFAIFLAMLDKAQTKRADVFVTPECWLDGYAASDRSSTPEKLRSVAQDVSTSPYLRRVAEEARKRALFICFGFTSLEEGKLFNAAGLWSDEGILLGVYHKTHLQEHDLQFEFGESLPVWPSRWGPIGIMICADRRWPETARVLRLEGARLILNPTYGFRGDLNEAIMRTRAYENQCFVAFTHPLESLLTNPKGEVQAREISDTPGVLVTKIDLRQAGNDDHLRDRRPELYGILSIPHGDAVNR